MTKSKKKNHSNAKEFAKRIRRWAAEILKLGKKPACFQPAACQKLAKEGQTFNSLREEKWGILRKLAYVCVRDL